MATATTSTDFETVIGVEVHAQLLTRSKMFCSCSSSYAASPPNTHVCPICLGMPGVLPVINRRAVEMTIMTGLALNCEIAAEAKFDRKNYHYPDLMKGYQISEYDMPICQNGWLDIEVEGRHKRIGITRVHLEEDTARLLHVKNAAGEEYSLVDVNRSGVPLMEIVSEPDLRSAEEARAYLVKLRQILRWIGASAANMEEGNMRCEPNVSIRPRGANEFGAKVELKNINSFRHAYDAIRFEEKRQREVVLAGGKIQQETRGWREDIGVAVPQRSKEFAHDYRYFPEPDLPPLAIGREWVEEILAGMPELPDTRRARFTQQYGLSDYDAGVLTGSRSLAEFFEATLVEWSQLAADLDQAQAAKTVANWLQSDVSRLLNARAVDIGDESVKVTPRHLAELLELVRAGTINATAAKQVLDVVFETGADPESVVAERGLAQIGAGDEVTGVIEQVLAANPKAVEDYRRGKQEAVKFLVGQVMRETRGRANAHLVTEMLVEKLG
ncbi:MAG TPA: Asp-tRNA(Asn)/Glu-tRNA(Gln) amidotransferase subunit GatB [Dehalococcoidia bacterium]|nr:Asp-tRNA(Asn)/Glu-tRNA(Gln) amidotransferase subunit GatB [Dehalococcoidia bacterium]